MARVCPAPLSGLEGGRRQGERARGLTGCKDPEAGAGVGGGHLGGAGGRRVRLDPVVGHCEDPALCLKEGRVFPASEGTGGIWLFSLRLPVRWPVGKSRDGQGC